MGLAQASQVIHITSADVLVADVGSLSSTINADTLTGTWTHISLPYKLVRPATPVVNTTAMTTWFRLSTEGLSPSSTQHLYLLRWETLGQIALYGDGRLLYRSLGSPKWNSFKHPSVFIPLNLSTDVAPPKQIMIRMDSLPGRPAAISSLYLGETDTLYFRYILRDWFENQLPFLFSMVFMAVGFFSLAIGLIYRHESFYFLVFVIAVLSLILRGHFYLGLEQLPISDPWFIWILFNAYDWQVLMVYLVLVSLHQTKRPWLNRGVILLTIAMTLLTQSWISGAINRSFFLYPLVMLLALTVLSLWDYRRSRSREALLFTSAIIVVLLFGIHEFLNRNYLFAIEGFYLLPYGSLGFLVVISYMLFHRYLGSLSEVVQVNAGLEQRLQVREAELAVSYDRLRHSEHRQTLVRERQRLMQDMHDGLGSSLISALRVVENGRMDEPEVAEVLKGCIDDLKLAIDSMEPVEADLLLLLATLRFRLGPRLENTGIILHWKVEHVPALDWLDPRNALHILRILQEAFTNIIKHTQATEISVSTGVEQDCAVVTIVDNGQGFSMENALNSGGKGLSNQQRRAEAIGAKLSWDSSNAGTRFILRLPINQRQAQL